MKTSLVLPNDSLRAASSDLRRNPRQRDIVARGIALLCDCGMRAAIEFLKRHAVTPQVIERVLLDPARRASA